MLTWIVLVVVGLVVLILLLDMLPDDQHMPSACPKCGSGDANGRRWFLPVRKGAVRCRACEVLFKEHPNGSLVEDKGAPK